MRDISKLLIGNRESGTGNRELVLCSLFGYITNVLKVQIGNNEPVPVTFLL